MGSHSAFVTLPYCSSAPVSLVAIAALLGGYCFGALWPHLVVITSEIFGTRYLARNYMFIDGSMFLVGGFCLARLLTSSVYQAHAKQDGQCVGASCFFLTHMLVIGLCGLGIISAAIVSCFSKTLYRSIGAA